MNPIIWRQGVCDPHVHVFQNKVYLYATHDAPCESNNFRMQDWQIWSSDDLVNWKLERTLYPGDFYCGTIDQCWAVDAASKDGKYYWYFSTGDWGVGVGVSDFPAGPYTDALGKPIVDHQTMPAGIPKWDPCVFTDDDGSSYLIVGDCRTPGSYSYLIGKLSDDMIHLAEPLRKIEYRGNICPEDKASIHKYHGRYYLTHSSFYAISDCVYGPYEYVGNTDCNIDHGSFFTFHNQTYFASGGMDNPNRYYRASYITPCHYRKNGEIVIDQEIMGYGSGQYDATMKNISASWYFDAPYDCKKENQDGEFIVSLKNGDFLGFPNISSVEENAQITFCVAAANGPVQITVHEQSKDGEVLGSCTVAPTKDWESYQYISCHLNRQKRNLSLYFTVSGENTSGIVHIKSFSFESNKERSAIQPALSSIGRGAALKPYPGASWGNVLKNFELKNVYLQAAVNGGSGGQATIEIYYVAKTENIDLHLLVNSKVTQVVSFKGDGEKIEKVCVPVLLEEGINYIRLENRSYQAGELAIDQLIVTKEKERAKTYCAANGELFPRGNGCWEGLPQRENDTSAYQGRTVKYLGTPGHGMIIHRVDGGKGGTFKAIFHYARQEEGDSCYELKINHVAVKQLDFSKTPGNTLADGMNYCAIVELQSGLNTLELVKTGNKDGGIWLDAITFIPYEQGDICHT